MNTTLCLCGHEVEYHFEKHRYSDDQGTCSLCPCRPYTPQDAGEVKTEVWRDFNAEFIKSGTVKECTE